MRISVIVIGIIAFAFGVLFVGQGLGYIMWPSSSFMLRDVTWAYYGGAIAAVGLAMIVAARRR